MPTANVIFTRYVQTRQFDLTSRNHDKFALLEALLTDMRKQELANYFNIPTSTLQARMDRLYHATGMDNRTNLMTDYIMFLEDELNENS